ncbi:MAG: amino acid racemase [Maribacter sp.]|nr:amino acid racemase [Maribacter sp.]
MKILGLIGGTSWHSTIVYYRLINELVGKEIGAQANPELLLYSLNIELMREQDPQKINVKYAEVAHILEIAGAEAIVICANTPHMAYEFVQPKIKIPILHIADAVGLQAQKLHHRRLGLLGNRPTMTKGFIQSRLKNNFGIEILIPEERFISECHDYVSKELTQGKFTEQAKQFFIHQMEELKKQGAEGIVLGCTELPMLLSQNDFDLPLFATTQLHAQMAADFILSNDI